MERTASGERGNFSASFEYEREGIVVRGPPMRLHPTVEGENIERGSEMEGASYELIPPENGWWGWGQRVKKESGVEGGVEGYVCGEEVVGEEVEKALHDDLLV